MSDAIGVQILEDVHNFSDVEYLHLLRQFVDVQLDEVDELPSLAELLDEVEVGLVLEGVFEFVDACVFEVREQFLLHHCLVLLLLSLEFLLLDLLHCVDVIVRILQDKIYIAICTLA
jgi:hypothetical protein